MSPPSLIRVMLVDDHPVVRAGVASLLGLAGDIEVVGDAANAAEAIAKARELKPDIVLLDIRLPGTSGWEVCQTLRVLLPDVRVIMFTTYQDEDFLLKALRAGAMGYVLKTASYEELVEAIRSVARGQRLLSPALIDTLVAQFSDLARELERRETGLDPEEIEILKLLAQGASNTEIAEKMHWSGVSIKRKLQTIFDKLGVEDRTSAAVEATRRGLI